MMLSLATGLQLLHDGVFSWDELLLYLVPLLVGLILFWALSRQKGASDEANDNSSDASSEATPDETENTT